MRQRRSFVTAILVMAACAGAGLAGALALTDSGDTSTAAIGEAFVSVLGLALGGVVGGAIVALLDLTRAGLAGSVLAALGAAALLWVALALVLAATGDGAWGIAAAVEAVVVLCAGIAVGTALRALGAGVRA